MTRSERRDRQPSAGFAQWRVGSIDEGRDAIGLLRTFRLKDEEAAAAATAIVTAQSMTVRNGQREA